MWKGLSLYSKSNNLKFYVFNFFLILKKKSSSHVLYIYKNFYFTIKYPEHHFLTLKLNLLLVKAWYNFIPKSFFFNLKIFTKSIKSLFIFFFKKIKFTGKGYYMYKSSINSLGLQFNYSHRLNLFFKNILIKRFNKRSWLFYNLNQTDLLKSLKYLKSRRPINIFTGRGIRFSKQIVYIKKGK